MRRIIHVDFRYKSPIGVILERLVLRLICDERRPTSYLLLLCIELAIGVFISDSASRSDY